MNYSLVLGILIIIVVGVVLGFVYYRRAKYRKQAAAFGWEVDYSPAIETVIGYNSSPFGAGFNRRASLRVYSTDASELTFEAFRYSCSEWSGGKHLIISVPLPRSMPLFYYLDNQHPLPGVYGLQIAQTPTCTAVSVNSYYGKEVFGLVSSAVTQLSQLVGADSINVAIDHHHLVFTGCPIEIAELAKAVQIVSQCARAIADSSSLSSFVGPEPPSRLSFHQHPAWGYYPADNSFLSRVGYTSDGYDHEAKDVIVCEASPLPFIALTHTWKEDHYSTDSNGKVRKRTESHSEEILEFSPQFPFVPFTCNHRRSLFSNDRVMFESADFNSRYKIGCRNPKFAMDVFHQRCMEYLLQLKNTPKFYLDEKLVLHYRVYEHNEASVAEAYETLSGIFSRVPRFVWQDLGTANPFIADSEQQP